MRVQLDPHMLQTETWLKISEILKERIEFHRTRLEVEKEPSTIAEHQGSIKEIRLLLQLGKVRERLAPDEVLGF